MKLKYTNTSLVEPVETTPVETRNIFFVICIFISLLFTSCISIKVNIGKKTDLYVLQLPVSKEQHYILRFYGVLNGDSFEVLQAYWFDNWGNGWTEARFIATGVLQLGPEYGKKKQSRLYSVMEPVVLEYPEVVKIRYKDTYLIGNDAITALNNRLLRIDAINEVIKENSSTASYSAFQEACGSLLFPEKYRKSAERKMLNKDSQKVFGDGTNWNVEYTQKVFPEYMWEARNSGTLYRDWEEALDLIYVTYTWDNMFDIGKSGVLDVYETNPPEEKEE